MKKLIYITLAITTLILLGLMPFASVSANPVSQAKQQACTGLTQLEPSQDCSTGSSTVNNLIATTVNILSYLIGAVAVIMLIIAGFRFAAAGGNSNAVSGAKSTLIYAIVGIILAVLAQVIVHWVIGTSTNIASGSLIIMLHHLY